MFVIFTIVLIFDKSHVICFKTDEDSLKMLTLSDDFCKLVETDHFVDSAATDFSEIFVIFTIQLSNKLHVFSFTTDEDSSTVFSDRARQF